jgi:hypothetical protein
LARASAARPELCHERILRVCDGNLEHVRFQTSTAATYEQETKTDNSYGQRTAASIHKECSSVSTQYGHDVPSTWKYSSFWLD